MKCAAMRWNDNDRPKLKITADNFFRSKDLKGGISA